MSYYKPGIKNFHQIFNPGEGVECGVEEINGVGQYSIQEVNTNIGE